MAQLNVGTKASALKKLFNDVEEVFFYPKQITSAMLAAGIDNLIELPVTEEGVNFDTGEADVSRTKLTTGMIWASKASKGDSDISFQIPSIDGTINNLFMKVNETSVVPSVTLLDNEFEGEGYSLAPKKVEGALIMPSADRQTTIILPAVEMFASLNLGDGDNPAYFNVSVTPVSNDDGDEIFILKNKKDVY